VRKTYAFTKSKPCVYFLVTQYGKFKILQLYNVEHTLLVTCEAIQEVSLDTHTSAHTLELTIRNCVSYKHVMLIFQMHFTTKGKSEDEVLHLL